MLDIRPPDIDAPPTGETADRSGVDCASNLELSASEPVGIWKPVDADEVPECEVVEDLGLFLVRDLDLSHRMNGSYVHLCYSTDFHDSVSLPFDVM
jgi:hypothetical protein